MPAHSENEVGVLVLVDKAVSAGPELEMCCKQSACSTSSYKSALYLMKPISMPLSSKRRWKESIPSSKEIVNKQHNDFHLLLGFLALNLRGYNSDFYDSRMAHRDEIQSPNEMDGVLSFYWTQTATLLMKQGI